MKDNISEEIDALERQLIKWKLFKQDKYSAFELSNEILNFVHSINVQFPNASIYFKRNSRAEIHLTDALSNLNHYSNGKLLEKDDFYLKEGIKQMQMGIRELIRELRQK